HAAVAERHHEARPALAGGDARAPDREQREAMDAPSRPEHEVVALTVELPIRVGAPAREERQPDADPDGEGEVREAVDGDAEQAVGARDQHPDDPRGGDEREEDLEPDAVPVELNLRA